MYPFPYLFVKSNPVLLEVAFPVQSAMPVRAKSCILTQHRAFLSLLTQNCWGKSVPQWLPWLPDGISTFSMICYHKYNTKRLLYFGLGDWFWISSLYWNENIRALNTVMRIHLESLLFLSYRWWEQGLKWKTLESFHVFEILGRQMKTGFTCINQGGPPLSLGACQL